MEFIPALGKSSEDIIAVPHMAQARQKRARSNDAKSQGSNKKQKTISPNAVVRDVVKIDELDWTPIEVTDPDLLGNGSDFMFLNLEEIDGVDVSRNDGKGKVLYRVCLLPRDPSTRD